jgi:hypothetical protein
VRRLLLLVVLGALALTLLRRRALAPGVSTRVVVGFADGSTEALPATSPQHDLLVAAAEGALAA